MHPLNVDIPYSVIDVGIKISSNDVQFVNVESPIDERDDGIIIFVNDVHSLKT